MALRLAYTLVVLSLVSPSLQYVSIELRNGSEPLDIDKYEDNSLFTYRYANFDGMTGYVWQWDSFPNNACLYIAPLPDSVKTNSSKWFALVENVLGCQESMIENVRNAGFDLVIGYSDNSSTPSLPKSLRNSEFPIVAISASYADTLWMNASTNTLTSAVSATITVLDADVILIAVIAGFSLFLMCSSALLVCVLCVRYRNRYGRYTVRNVHNEPFHQRYAQARLARQELIESILRQLQQLQGEERLHVPLGEVATKALPLKPFLDVRRESSTKEVCAICVDDFRENDMTRVLPCNHFFHPDCIDPWLISHSSMCPLCKQSVSRANEGRHAPQARPHAHLETMTEEDDTSSLDSFGTPTLALTDVTDTPPPSTLSPSAVNTRPSTNADSSSISSDTPLLDGAPSIHVYAST